MATLDSLVKDFLTASDSLEMIISIRARRTVASRSRKPSRVPDPKKPKVIKEIKKLSVEQLEELYNQLVEERNSNNE